MNSVERVKALCKERKIAISKLEKELGYANGYIGQLRKGVLPDNRLREIADYLSVTPEYLMNGEETIKESIQKDELKSDCLDSAYFRVMQDAKKRGCSPEDIQIALDFIEQARRHDK